MNFEQIKAQGEEVIEMMRAIGEANAAETPSQLVDLGTAIAWESAFTLMQGYKSNMPEEDARGALVASVSKRFLLEALTDILGADKTPRTLH